MIKNLKNIDLNSERCNLRPRELDKELLEKGLKYFIIFLLPSSLFKLRNKILR